MLSVMRTENFGIKHQDGHDELDDIQTSGTGGRQRKIKMTRSGVSLAAEQKMQLIVHIHERPQIWDSGNEQFRSNQSRQNAFNEVAELLSAEHSETFSRIQIQEEWGKLRYCFTRIVKKLLEEGSGRIVDAQLGAITWPYWKLMEFLLEGVKSQLQNQTNDPGSDGSQENLKGEYTNYFDSPGKLSVQNVGPRLRKRRANVSRKSSGNNNDTELHDELNPSANEILSRALIGISPQDILMANIAAINNSHQLLEQQNASSMLNDEMLVEKEIVAGNNIAAKYLNNDEPTQNLLNGQILQQQHLCSNGVSTNKQHSETVAMELVAAAMCLEKQQQQIEQQQQQQIQQQQRQQRSSLRRKRKGLDFLLRNTSLQKQQENDGVITPAKSLDTAASYFSPARTIAETIASSNHSRLTDISDVLTNTPQQQQIHAADAGVAELDKDSLCSGNSRCAAIETANTNPSTPEDINEAFGRCIVQQLQTVAKRNSLLCVQMRKELMDVCFKFEMRACDDTEQDHPIRKCSNNINQ